MTLPTPPAGMTRRTLPASSPSAGRTYLAPSNPAALPAGAWVVVGLHITAHNAVDGANDLYWITGNPATTGWHRHAQSNGYHLLLGEGVDGRWNVGAGWPGGAQDDETYILDMLADYNVAGRTYVSGGSAGGAMAWAMTAKYPQVFAGCASASGWAPLYPSTPIDCYHTHGMSDTAVPYLGGAGVYGYTFPLGRNELVNQIRGSYIVHRIDAGGHGPRGWTAGEQLLFWRRAANNYP